MSTCSVLIDLFLIIGGGVVVGGGVNMDKQKSFRVKFWKQINLIVEAKGIKGREQENA